MSANGLSILATASQDLHVGAERAIMPVPRISLSIRQATMADVPFIDRLQKLHNKMLGFMSFAQLRGYIEGEHVLLAADDIGQPLGYVIAKDRYFKRDDVGVIFQLNIAPGVQRKLVGAALIGAVFERAAYGCKLFCCWCAQDLEANHFWESIGFVPLAFRTGGRTTRRMAGAPGKSPAPPGPRIHIFWQRRIREGDSETPYWFPCQTNAGAIVEDRLVFPIPPGTHWSDAKPVLLPGMRVEKKALPAERRRVKQPPARPMTQTVAQGLRFVTPAEVVAKAEKKPEKRERQKNDPRHVAMARELRDRYLEAINSGRMLLSAAAGKYDVSRPRLLPAAPTNVNHLPLLEAA